MRKVYSSPTIVPCIFLRVHSSVVLIKILFNSRVHQLGYTYYKKAIPTDRLRIAEQRSTHFRP